MGHLAVSKAFYSGVRCQTFVGFIYVFFLPPSHNAVTVETRGQNTASFTVLWLWGTVLQMKGARDRSPEEPRYSLWFFPGFWSLYDTRNSQMSHFSHRNAAMDKQWDTSTWSPVESSSQNPGTVWWRSVDFPSWLKWHKHLYNLLIPSKILLIFIRFNTFLFVLLISSGFFWKAVFHLKSVL